MKKVLSLLATITIIVSLFTINVQAYSNKDFLTITQDIINKYGVFEQVEGSGGTHYSGLIFGEFIDFDKNGIDEMVLAYMVWGNYGVKEGRVAVFGIKNGSIKQLFSEKIGPKLTQMEYTPSITFKHTSSNVILIVDAECDSKPKDGLNEKRCVFTMKNGISSCDIYYGETLDVFEVGEIIYTKCLINNMLVSSSEYCSNIDYLLKNSARVNLYRGQATIEDSPQYKYISYDKIVDFLNLLDEKVASEIKVMLDGQKIDFDVLPIIEKERTLVPLRAIFEALGATVEWNDETQTITSTKGDTVITMAIDKNEMYKNGEMIWLDVAPTIINSRTLVPVRAIAEAFSCNVSWNANNNTVVISY